MTRADFQDYHSRGSLVPEHFDTAPFCPYCGLYDQNYPDNCSDIVFKIHLDKFEREWDYFEWLKDCPSPMYHGYDFIAYYGGPLVNCVEVYTIAGKELIQ